MNNLFRSIKMSILRKSMYYCENSPVYYEIHVMLHSEKANNNAISCFSKSILQYLAPYMFQMLIKTGTVNRENHSGSRVEKDFYSTKKFLKLFTSVSTFYWSRNILLHEDYIKFFKECDIDLKSFIQTDMYVQLYASEIEHMDLLKYFNANKLYLKFTPINSEPMDFYLPGYEIKIESHYDRNGYKHIFHTKKHLDSLNLELFCESKLVDLISVKYLKINSVEDIEKYLPNLKRINSLSIWSSYSVENLGKYDIDYLTIQGGFERNYLDFDFRKLKEISIGIEATIKNGIIDFSDNDGSELADIILEDCAIYGGITEYENITFFNCEWYDENNEEIIF